MCLVIGDGEREMLRGEKEKLETDLSITKTCLHTLETRLQVAERELAHSRLKEKTSPHITEAPPPPQNGVTEQHFTSRVQCVQRV